MIINGIETTIHRELPWDLPEATLRLPVQGSFELPVVQRQKIIELIVPSFQNVLYHSWA